MAEFVDVMKQAKRMCGMYSSCADGCPLGMYGDCFASAIPSDIDYVEGIVTQWAKEHPEPQYPTWLEWMEHEGIVELSPIGIGQTLPKAERPIAADIAERLGIKPNSVQSLDDAIREFNSKWSVGGAKMDGGEDDVDRGGGIVSGGGADRVSGGRGAGSGE